MDNGAGAGEAGELLERLVEDVAGIEVWYDENISSTFYRRVWNLFGGDTWIDCCVELHFPIDEIVRMVLMDFFDCIVDFFEVGVFATGTVGGIGKHSDFGLFAGIFSKCFCSIFDDSVELLFGGLLINAAVGESEGCVVFLADETAREKR